MEVPEEAEARFEAAAEAHEEVVAAPEVEAADPGVVVAVEFDLRFSTHQFPLT